MNFMLRATAMVALSFLVFASGSTLVGAAQPIQDSADVRKALTQGDEAGSAKYEFQYSTPDQSGAARRFVVFLRTQLENGEPLDSELIVIAVKKKAGRLLAKQVFRDVSVLGLRSAKKAGLSEKELQAVFLEQGRFDMRRAGGKEKYREFARSRLAEGGMSTDERWIFDQLLGKGWDQARSSG